MPKPGTAAGYWKERPVFGRASPPPRWSSTRTHPGLRPKQITTVILLAPSLQRRLQWSGPTPPTALARSTHRSRRLPVAGRRSSCACVRERVRTRKLRYRHASRGRESAEHPGRGWQHRGLAVRSPGALGGGSGCKTAPDSQGRAPWSPRSVRRE